MYIVTSNSTYFTQVKTMYVKIVLNDSTWVNVLSFIPPLTISHQNSADVFTSRLYKWQPEQMIVFMMIYTEGGIWNDKSDIL